MKNYNVTQLNPGDNFERHVYHRDMFAHYLRWTHVLNIARIGMNILDVGCGTGGLYEVFYRNRYKPTNYTGVDVRLKTIENNKLKFKMATWLNLDIVNDLLPVNKWDIIASFEVMEHIGKTNGPKFLTNIKKVMGSKTTLLISTPCYDSQVGAADNHTFDAGDGQGIIPQEYTYQELRDLLERYFKIETVFGTFASQKDYKPILNDWQNKMFNHLVTYYDSNLVSNLMAPFFPEKSRNCLWVLRLK